MDTWQLQLLHFWLFLGIYLAALLGNGLIITALDLGSISTTVPQIMANSLWDSRAISYWGCAAQVFFFLFLIAAEYCILTIMAYDRYVAICKPLHYGTLLGSRACTNKTAAAWGSGFLHAVLHTSSTFSLPLCQGNAVDQFFCEIPQILKLACLDSFFREVGVLVVSVLVHFYCFVFIVLSYRQLVRVNLSLLDLGSISTTVPKSMANSLWDSRAISYWGCAAQVFFFLFLIAAEYCILTIMAYDRYVAICKPLHYGTLLGSRACTNKTAAAWGSGFLHAVLHTANTFSLPLCQGNVVDQFFCEILKLSCADSYLRKVGLIVVSLLAAFGWFVFIVLSYVQIFMAVLRIPSEQGQHKAFSMCLPHLAVVSLFISTGMFNYLKPLSISSVYAGLAVAGLYLLVSPALNSLIYSMRNQDLEDALRKLLIYAILWVQDG
nr:PREDICTED: LOW QUALITY PROTEIN: olfactory receptor 14C36-like [Haliaeetus albicilla]